MPTNYSEKRGLHPSSGGSKGSLPSGRWCSSERRLMIFKTEVSERNFSPFGEGDASASGCLTSLDEERETWTAESLRVLISIIRRKLVILDWGRTKDFGGTRFDTKVTPSLSAL